MRFNNAAVMAVMLNSWDFKKKACGGGGIIGLVFAARDWFWYLQLLCRPNKIAQNLKSN